VAAALVGGLGCQGEGTSPAGADSFPDFASLTVRPDLYVRSRAIPERFLDPPGCTKEGELQPNGTGRWLNFMTDEKLPDPGPPAWRPEPQEPRDGHGTYEVTAYPCEPPTPAQLTAAQDLWDRSLEAALANGWFDVSKAEADGFHIGHPGERIHYVHDDFMNDDGVLDPERPEFLVVFETKTGERMLAGYMYMLRTPGERGPQIGGPLTVWHYHMMDLHCWRNGLVVARPEADGTCPVGTPSRRTPEMLHVWFFDRRYGPFATDMKPPKGLTGAPTSTCHGLPGEEESPECSDPARP